MFTCDVQHNIVLTITSNEDDTVFMLVWWELTPLHYKVESNALLLILDEQCYSTRQIIPGNMDFCSLT